ncbi:hypothetical protein N2601_17855 [Rhizobium sp. CB3060]|uniref:hypothetical protein n=1 Tax=Rhizobium sp. CB3060 TaxID=3138255 RepID=UPI0021A612B4|nr:hypothetical protein [Rhizobium tropici]UWU21089.1 hypothetical protein N2601_17855 [Rhizobium tropici]
MPALFNLPHVPAFNDWMRAVRADAISRGGKAWSKSELTRMGAEYRRKGSMLHVQDRQPGEIANPITGELVTGCLSIGRLAASLGITTDQLTDEMERLQLVHRVLDFREVPMIIDPALRKPRYFQTPEASPKGIEKGLVIPIETHLGGGQFRTMIVITPQGQALLGRAGRNEKRPEKKIDQKRCLIEELMAAGHRQAEIVRMTSFPKQTVSRYVKAIRLAF